MYIMGCDKVYVSDEFNFVGVIYVFIFWFSVSYYYGQFKDIYWQYYFGLLYILLLGEGLLLCSDLCYFDSGEDGVVIFGLVDNCNFNVMFILCVGVYVFGIGVQKMIGNDVFLVFNGYIMFYVVNFMVYQIFI